MKTFRIISLITLILTGILAAEDKKEDAKVIEVQTVGHVERPLSVSVTKDMTMKEFYRQVKPTSLAFKWLITVIRISQVSHENSTRLVSGTQRQFIDYYVESETRLRDLDLKTGDMIYIQKKIPRSR